MVKARIRKIIQETPDVKTFILELDENMDFKAGQFVMAEIPEDKFNQKIPPKPFSIANAPNDKYEMRLIIKIQPDGAFSPYLDKLKVGDELGVKGPYGRFTLERGESKEVTLIGAGTGIAPIRGIMEFALKNKIKVNLFYCDKTEEHLININEFDNLSKEINAKIFVTREKNSKRICRYIEKEDLKNTTKQGLFFVCGPPTFVNKKVEILESLGIKENQIKTERYG
tara:strand:+ start:6274 stop:6951 length:678 start_codon:yes stop_codon:yes gene_type:complete